MSKKQKQAVTSGFASKVEAAVQSYRLAEYPELARQLFADLGLEYFHDYFMEHSFKQQPKDKKAYHSFAHSLQVALNCYEGALYNHLTSREKKMILVAGLYHDANHTQGEQSDASNIHFAVSCLRVANDYAPEHVKFKEDELQLIIETIRLTEYPYKVKAPKSVFAKIIRDADMMSVYTEDIDLLTDLFVGMYCEANAPRRWIGESLTLEEFCQRQVEFTSRLGWYTSWGKVKSFRRNYPEAAKRMVHVLRIAGRHVPA